MNNSSHFISNGKSNTASRLIKSVVAGLEQLKSYEIQPNGVWGRVATIICGNVTIKSDELDLEITVKFDDDMEANDAEVVIYNLSDNTKNQFKEGSKISIEAGYKGDTGVIFKGYITNAYTKYEGADRITRIKCIDDVSKKNKKLVEKTYRAGTKASYILKDLLNQTGLTIKVFKVRRDWTYKDDEKVDGDLFENIKKYSEVCGVSTYVKNGEIISRHIKVGDATNFKLSADTGLINSPEPYEEELTAEDFKENIKGYEAECLLQHRFYAGAIVELASESAKGKFRICSGEHVFNPSEAISKIKMY